MLLQACRSSELCKNLYIHLLQFPFNIPDNHLLARGRKKKKGIILVTVPVWGEKEKKEKCHVVRTSHFSGV